MYLQNSELCLRKLTTHYKNSTWSGAYFMNDFGMQICDLAVNKLVTKAKTSWISEWPGEAVFLTGIKTHCKQKCHHVIVFVSTAIGFASLSHLPSMLSWFTSWFLGLRTGMRYISRTVFWGSIDISYWRSVYLSKYRKENILALRWLLGWNPIKATI